MIILLANTTIVSSMKFLNALKVKRALCAFFFFFFLVQPFSSVFAFPGMAVEESAIATDNNLDLSRKPVHLVLMQHDSPEGVSGWQLLHNQVEGLLAGVEDPADREKFLELKRNLRSKFEEFQRLEAEKLELITDAKKREKYGLEFKLTAAICVITVGFAGYEEREVLIQAYRGLPELTWSAITAAGTIGFAGVYEGVIQAFASKYSQWLFDRDYNPWKSLKKDKSDPADRWLRREADIFVKRYFASVPFTMVINVGQMVSGTTEVNSAHDVLGVVGSAAFHGGVYVLSSHAYWSHAKWIKEQERIPERTREIRSHYVNFGLTTTANIAFITGSEKLSIYLFASGVAFHTGSIAYENAVRPGIIWLKNGYKKLRKKHLPVSEVIDQDMLVKDPCGGLFL